MASPETQDYTVAAFEGITRGTLGKLAEGATRLIPKRQKQPKLFVPPRRDPDFIGRRDKIRETVEKLAKGDKGVYIHGGPGIGKSALAVEVVHEKRKTRKFKKDIIKKDIIWIELHGDSLGQICDRVASGLHTTDVQSTHDENQKMAILRDALRKQRSLIVLDNADGQSALAADQFSKGVTNQLLVTSRDSMDLQEVRVDPLTPDEAVDVLKRKGPDDLSEKDTAQLPEIAEITGYHALALVLAGRQLHRQTASLLLESLRSKVLDPLFEPNNPGRNVRAVIATSYERLSRKQKHLLSALGAFGGDLDLEAALFSVNEDVRTDLAALVGSSLVIFDREAERYRLHTLIREFAREKLGRWRFGTKGELYKRMAAFYLVYAVEYRTAQVEDYDALELERPNIFSALDWYCDHGPRDDKDWAAIIVDQNYALARFLDLRGFWGQRITYSTVGIECARFLGDEAKLAGIVHNLALTYQNQGNLEEARKLYGESLEIGRKLGHQQGIASTLHQLGNIAYLKGDYSEAERLYQESLKIEKTLGNQEGIAQSLHQLGMIAEDKGDYPEAEKLYGQSLEIARKLGDQQGIAGTLHELGNAAYLKGDYPEAERLYGASLEIAKKLGDQGGIATTLHQLGMIAQTQGDYNEAEKLYKESLEIKNKLGNQQGIAATLHQMGLVKEATGDLKGAADLFREALAILERVGSPMAEKAQRLLREVEGKLASQ